MALKNGYYNRGAGASFAPAYQISGVPFVTSSNGTNVTNMPIRINFPYATRFFQVTNTGQEPLRIGFTENGVNGVGGTVSGSATGYHSQNYFVLSGSTSANNSTSTVRLELRCKSLFFRSDAPGTKAGFTLVAGLTSVESSQFPILTGSQGFQGIG